MKIVTIGGGTGTAVVNEALLKTGKVEFISSIATTFDNGGATQRRRLDSYGNEIAYSDAIRVMLSLIDPITLSDSNVEVVKRWFLHRDFKNTVLGQEITNRFFNKENGFMQIEKDLRSLGVRLRGEVLPTSASFSHIVFTTKSGMRYQGENLLDDHRISRDMVSEITLSPEVDAYIPGTEAIKNADFIFLSCGSIYGSLLCNFLPRGMREAMNDTKAKIYLVTNLFSSRNETHDIKPLAYAKLVEKYAGRIVSGLIIPKMSREEFEAQYPRVAYLYKMRESSYFLGWGKEELDKARNNKIDIIAHNAIRVIEIPEENMAIVRHDSDKLAQSFQKLL